MSFYHFKIGFSLNHVLKLLLLKTLPHTGSNLHCAGPLVLLGYLPNIGEDKKKSLTIQARSLWHCAIVHMVNPALATQIVRRLDYQRKTILSEMKGP